ncbi:MAG: DUF4058 family protein [Planctomycetaceae bacterium]|nr:MAG: DUF4058 family protein [Planctomycetaceae bacterium]
MGEPWGHDGPRGNASRIGGRPLACRETTRTSTSWFGWAARSATRVHLASFPFDASEPSMSSSPFPGMDPYLERFWRDVHHAMVTYARDQLQPQLAPELRARMEERVFVTGGEGVLGHRVPDVYVVEYPPRGSALAVEDRVEELVEPFTVALPDVRLTEPYIEIIDASSGNRVVSVIEFLSPTNKLPGEGRGEYLRKKNECHQARVPLVEIDLTRQGRRKEVLPLGSIPAGHHTTYLVCVQRYHPQHRLEYYPIPLASRLPAIRIPLRPDDRDVLLRLQSLVDQAYENGRYDDLEYAEPLAPPLDADESAWFQQRLQSLGRHESKRPR